MPMHQQPQDLSLSNTVTQIVNRKTEKRKGPGGHVHEKLLLSNKECNIDY